MDGGGGAVAAVGSGDGSTGLAAGVIHYGQTRDVFFPSQPGVCPK